MTIDRRTLVGATLVAGAAAATGAQPAAAQTMPGEHVTRWPPSDTFRLWPGRPPGSPAVLPVPAPSMNGPRDRRELWLRGVAMPTVSVFRPSRPNGIGIVSIPGGGYSFLGVENEGLKVADRFTDMGFTVFVLAYRLPGEGWLNRALVPLQDAQRAVRLIRAQTARYRVQPGKLAVLGFSAGGHLGASLSTLFNERVYDPVDAADRLPARPDSAGLIYPVTSLAQVIATSASRGNLLGPDPTEAMIARFSSDRRVTSACPPMFLAHALNDPIVPPDMTLNMLAAARAARVPVEAHLYESGGHGFGVAASSKDVPHGWTELFAAFLKRHLD